MKDIFVVRISYGREVEGWEIPEVRDIYYFEDFSIAKEFILKNITMPFEKFKKKHLTIDLYDYTEVDIWIDHPIIYKTAELNDAEDEPYYDDDYYGGYGYSYDMDKNDGWKPWDNDTMKKEICDG